MNDGFVYSNNIVVYGLNGITFQEARAVQELNREGTVADGRWFSLANNTGRPMSSETWVGLT